MDWMSNRNEIYHRPCEGWTVVIDGRHCSRCGEEIPPAILAQTGPTRLHALDELREKTRAVSEKLAALRAGSRPGTRA